jgi:hypothetical protein
MPAEKRNGIKGKDISGKYSMDDEQQKAKLMDRAAKALSDTFLSTPYPDKERPIDREAWSRAVQEQGGADEEARKKRGYGFPK